MVAIATVSSFRAPRRHRRGLTLGPAQEASG
jgi:hypothetical protein